MKRVLLIILVLTVLVAGGLVAQSVLRSRGSAAGSRTQVKLPPATADVTRMTLVETKTLAGTLGYGAPVPVDAVGQGTLTWIAAVGSTVKRGDTLFRIDQRPVVSLYGSVPLYRALRAGAVGGDVKQFETNLSALGYKGFTVDNTFSSATATAAKAWQTKLGLLPATGAVELGQVVYTSGPVRVAAQVSRVGAAAGRGDAGATVLSYTATTRLVSVSLNVADQGLATAGEKVTVTIPGGKQVDGTITKVGTVATGQDQGNSGTSGGGNPVSTDATIAVTVNLADQKALGSLEAAPVDVDFVSDKREGVLTVPVAALLALPQGGYGVEVVEGSTSRTVAVTPGLFASGRVEISGNGIEEGTKVGMPK
jgi:hypothetical protein